MDGYDPSLKGVLHERWAQIVAWLRDLVIVIRPARPEAVDPTKILDPKELEILRLFVQGKTEREIAFRLFMSVDSVFRRRRVIARKLGVRRCDLRRVRIPSA